MHIRWCLNTAFLGLVMACNTAEKGAVTPPPAPPKPTSSTPPAVAAKQPIPEKPTTVVRGIARPLMTRTAGMALVDRVDVGNDQDERAHNYAVNEPTFRGAREFLIPSENASYSEDGRAMKAGEAFRVKVVPGEENLLVKAFDTLARDQKVKVSIDGKVAGEWPVPDGGASRYGEATFALSPALIGSRTQLDIKLDYVSGAPDTNAFVYWVYATPAQKLVNPVSTKVTGLTLTDTLDVGAEPDETVHGYVIDKASYAGVQQFEWPSNGQPFLENGRANRSYESFRMKVAPSKDHLLVKAFDTYSKNQVVRVLVEGSVVGQWTLPDGTPRYAEGSFRIPAKFIGNKTEVSVRVEFVSATLDANSFHYWLFAEPVVRNG